MTDLVGYKLVDNATDDVVDQWGGTWGQCPSIPNPLVLPNGIQVCGAATGIDYGGFTLQPWEIDEPPPPIPSSVSRRQFFEGLALQGVISDDEALAAMGGVIPAPMLAFVEQIDDAAAKHKAKMLLAGARDFERAHPLVEQFATALGYTPEQVDGFFQLCAAQ